MASLVSNWFSDAALQIYFQIYTASGGWDSACRVIVEVSTYCSICDIVNLLLFPAVELPRWIICFVLNLKKWFQFTPCIGVNGEFIATKSLGSLKIISETSSMWCHFLLNPRPQSSQEYRGVDYGLEYFHCLRIGSLISGQRYMVVSPKLTTKNEKARIRDREWSHRWTNGHLIESHASPPNLCKLQLQQ